MKIVNYIDYNETLMLKLPTTKKESKLWKFYIQNLKNALKFNLYAYKEFIEGKHSLTKYERAFLKYNKQYEGLNFNPEKIMKIYEILNNIKLELKKRYNSLPYQSKSVFFNETDEDATQRAQYLISN